MSKSAWTIYLWPGLPQLWLDGAASGLLLAAGCGALLNLLVLSTYVWNELLTPAQLWAGWGAVGLLWVGGALFSLRTQRRRKAILSAPAIEDLFKQAMCEYLRGHWYEAEAILSRLLAANAADIEARLTWATLLRRTRRYAEAKAQLTILERLDGGARWREEIAREWQALASAQSGLAGWLNVPQPTASQPTAAVPQAKAA